MATNFTEAQKQSLENDIRTMLFYTENSANSSTLYSFSNAQAGNSGWSFGMMQFDVKTNPNAASFLKGIGFTNAQISELQQSSTPADLQAMNNLLATNKSAVDQLVDDTVATYVSTLDNVVNYVRNYSPTNATAILNDPSLQLAIVDYHNQFNISGLGSSSPPANGMLSFLCGNTVTPYQTAVTPSSTISFDDIQNFIDASKFGVQNPSAVSGRVDRYNQAMGAIDSNQLIGTNGNASQTSAVIDGVDALTGDISPNAVANGIFDVIGVNGEVKAQISPAVNGPYVEATTYANGATSVTVNGNGDIINIQNASVSVGAGSQVTINGSDLTVQGATGDNITIGGNGSAGQSNIVYANGATVNVSSSSRADIFGSNDTVSAGANDNYGVYGADNTINSQSSSNVWIGNYGTSSASDHDQVNANGCVVTVGDFFNASIAGAGTVAADSYDNLATYGDNTHVTISGQDTTLNNYGAGVVTTANGSGDVTNNHGYDDATYNYGSGDDTYDYGTDEYNYNYGSNEYGWAASSSDYNYDANSSDTGGGYTYDPGSGYGYYGYYGYYGFAGKPAANDAAKGSDIGSIAQFDQAHGKPGAAAVAQKAQAEIGNAIAHDAKVALSGAKWENSTVTWSVGDGGDFSGSMSPSEVQAVKQAFAEWGTATGLNFVEVASTDAADITVGMGSFDTSTTGVVGFTTFRAKAGHIQPGAVVRVEDVSEDPLVSGADDASVYGGTDATFSQALLHEIGHALGFGDNADPASVESYYLSAANRTLSSNDIAQAAALYGRGPAAIKEAHQIIQAMSSFAPASMAGATAVNDPGGSPLSGLYGGNYLARRAH